MGKDKPRYELIAILGLLGYILAVVGVVGGIITYVATLGLAGVVIAGIAWMILGIDLEDRYYKIQGIILVASPVIVFIITYAWMYTLMYQRIITPSPWIEETVLETLIDQILLLVSVIALIAWVTEVFHIVGHFRAGRELEINLFKYSATTRLITLALNMTATLLLTQSTMEHKHELIKILQELTETEEPSMISEETILELARIMGPPLVLALLATITMIIANIISAVSFYKLKARKQR